MTVWFALGIFLLGASAGALLARIVSAGKILELKMKLEQREKQLTADQQEMKEPPPKDSRVA
jgi:hypothetical protein